jgi:imidazolonepropionase-like amidohydrolase
MAGFLGEQDQVGTLAAGKAADRVVIQGSVGEYGRYREG